MANSILDISISLLNSIGGVENKKCSHSKEPNIDKISISIKVWRYRDTKGGFVRAAGNLGDNFWEKARRNK